MLAALVDLSRSGHYLHWGFIQLSAANALVVLAMVVVFVLALLVPFHTARRGR
jgi:drug/metabolite transporter superfamily protein YnfA